MLRLDHEQEQLRRARRRLLIVGVVGAAIIIFTLWIVKLPSVFRHNQEMLPDTFSGLKGADVELGEQWQMFKKRIRRVP